ncbi:LON peptidase substrate-binding domain-containing protein [Halothiobacillus sp.]|uniref:LON peptidase substrate-binding domain-containing protein n=1 Tax=Halothiobacillus sp. TaxID=1891311 RepID=UPI0019B14AF4|nr:LON peptidase substrate-binding domain-containing protein [Halothiobacillus sp.]MBD3817203.1 LON peptidase substrate-binding domain-containing protein [Halothiobacillus sp.]MDD4967206.1 LON peptidase substrate-binding domain-containing protein [Halothiobacillus sp.]
MKDVTVLPLFPLHTVLFPGGYLPLRIFETRYIDMVRTCLREGSPFGVVLLKQGCEVRQDDDDCTEFYELGASAQIVDTDIGSDGVLHIEALGRGRFRVLHSWSERDGLFRGEVEWLPEATVVARSDADERLRNFLARIMDSSDLRYPNAPFDDPVWVVYRLLERLPVKLEDRQRVLGAERLDLTVRHLSAMIAAFE